MKQFYRWCLALCVSSMSAQTHDSITHLEEVVLTENRLKIPLNQSARSVQIISAQAIAQMPAKSLNEILSYANGVDMRQRGPFGTQADVSIDGGSFEQTLVLINGIKMSDPQTAHNTMNLPLPVEAIARIEILRGPAARVYGANSLTGAINIVTHRPTDTAVFAQVFGGSNFKKNNENDSTAWYTSSGVQFGGRWTNQSVGQQLYGALENGSGYRYNTAYHNVRLFYQGDANWNENHQLQWMGGYTRAQFGANGFYAAPGDIESEEVVETLVGSVQTSHQLNANWHLRPQLGYRYTYDDYRYFRNDLSRARSQHYGTALNAQLNATYDYTGGRIGLGSEWRGEYITSSNIGDHDRSNMGFYAEWQTEPLAQLHLTIGSYINYNTAFNWAFFPGVDASYQFHEHWRILANIGSSQRIPSFSDLYLNQAPGNIGNPNLQPEAAWQWEAGWAYANNHFSGQMTVFWRDIRDFIDWNREHTLVPYQSQNAGDLRTLGITTQWNYRHPTANGTWRAQLSYTYLHPEQKNFHTDLISKYQLESLRHQLIGQLNYQINKWELGVSQRYQERLSYTDYYLVDARVRYNLPHWSLYVDGQNLTDKTYVEAGAVPLPGRWLSVGVQFRTKL